MKIHLHKPYKIAPSKQARYNSHYKIPAGESLVVPSRELGNECSCDVRWEDENGELHLLSNAVFSNDNLVLVNAMVDTKLYELWSHYYQPVQTEQIK